MNMKNIKKNPTEPQFQDHVRNINTGVTGVVIAKYFGGGYQKNLIFVDIRLDTEDKVWWTSPITNWEILKRYEEDD